MKIIFTFAAALLIASNLFGQNLSSHNCQLASNNSGEASWAVIPGKQLQQDQAGVKDFDGNIYKTIKIGTQIWMTENLKTTRYLNGDLIGTSSPATLDIDSEKKPKYQWAYDGDESNVASYGRLYTWYAVTDSRNVCPSGWHVPSDNEWDTLITYLGGESVAGGKLKETGTTHWTYDPGSTNDVGFTALPGGTRASNGTFSDIGCICYWWSATESSDTHVWTRHIHHFIGDIYNFDYYKEIGISVRCIKNL
jgi:uncharacterized protein (TIGR02145 family)